jgi:hypothetical protein
VVGIDHAPRRPLHHHVDDPLLPVVAAGGHDHVRMDGQVAPLLLLGAGAEVERTVLPHGDESVMGQPFSSAKRRASR